MRAIIFKMLYTRLKMSCSRIILCSEVINMKKSYSVKEFVSSYGSVGFDQFLKRQSDRFEQTFGKTISENIEIELIFLNNYEMTHAYQEFRFNRDFSKIYTVRYHQYKENTLVVSGQKTLFDYLGSREPNLLTLSRDLNIDFEVKFVQVYSGTAFNGNVVNGELLGRQCLVEVNELVPELSLGLLFQIGNDEQEFELLLTRIIPFQSVLIV